MTRNELIDGGPGKDARLLYSSFGECIEEQWLEHSAEPVVNGNVKALLGTLEDTGGDFIAHEFTQDVLEGAVIELEFFGQARGKLDNAVIEKWRTDFERVSHRHAVALV